MDDDHEFCKRCNCCDLSYEHCDSCEDGFDGHDCGEDCCPCLDPEENQVCDICDGRGGWDVCLGRCDENGEHTK